MALNDEQLKAAKSVERALNKAGKVGLTGGVYDKGFILFPEGQDLEKTIEENFSGNEENSISLYTPSIDLDGGAGV